MSSSDPSRLPRLSRRLVIASGASLAAAAAGAGLYASAVKPDDLARALLRDMVGPFRMSSAEFELFLTRFQTGFSLPGGMRRGLLAGLGQTGLLPVLLSAVPDSVVSGVVDLRRALVTSFLLDTDFLAPERSSDEPVRFIERGGACANPFARLDP